MFFQKSSLNIFEMRVFIADKIRGIKDVAEEWIEELEKMKSVGFFHIQQSKKLKELEK